MLSSRHTVAAGVFASMLFAQYDTRSNRLRDDQTWADKNEISAADVRAMRTLVGILDNTAGAAILSTIDREVGTDDVNIAIDFVYTATDTEPDAKWRVMEVNAAEPQLVNRTQHETLGRAQHDLLARQIARIATKSKESRP